MKKKITVGIIFGGKSAEHEVSLQSAQSIVRALDTKKYQPVLIGIDKQGTWHLQSTRQTLPNATRKALTLVTNRTNKSIAGLTQKTTPTIDVMFPVLHGPYGEDGTIQGLLKLMDIPFVGSGVLGSAIGMDKEITKRLLQEAGLPIARFICLRQSKDCNFATATRRLSLPLFVKPANLGSSVGVSKVKNKAEFDKAVHTAFRYDRKVLVEEAIIGREIECSVLGNEQPRASVPGEIIVQADFYSYDAKYLDENGARLQIPAKLSSSLQKKIQHLAIATFKTLNLEGLARIDFFLQKNNKIFINEANTLPGFTAISMYPKLWEASGLSYSKLLDTLIELALENHRKNSNLKVSYL